VVKWPDADENFVPNQYFVLVRTDLEFLGQNPGDFDSVTGVSITVIGRALEIPYKLEPGSCDLETSLAGHRLRLLFDHSLPAGGSKSSIWRVISSAIDKKVVKTIVSGGFSVYINQRIYFLLIAPQHGDASLMLEWAQGISYTPPTRRAEWRLCSLALSSLLRLFECSEGRVEKCKMNEKECSSKYSK
jgi:hypothetical protein